MGGGGRAGFWEPTVSVPLAWGQQRKRTPHGIPLPKSKENKRQGVGCALWSSRLHRFPSPQPSQLICRRQGDGVRTWAMASDPPRGTSQLGAGHLRAYLSPVVPQHTHLPSGSNQYFHWLRPNLGQALSSCSGHPNPGRLVHHCQYLSGGDQCTGQVTREEATTGFELRP